MSESDESEYMKAASDSFRNGALGIVSGLSYMGRAFWVWSDDHPILRLVILAPISAIITELIFSTVGFLHTFFYGKTVAVSNDIVLQTLPLPIGLSIYLLFVLWLLTALTAYFRLVELRERVENLESNQK